MAEGGVQVTRIFEQPEGAVSFYSDHTQIIGTGSENVVQFYETIPGPPGPGGQLQIVKTRLRSTIMLSPAHAKNIGNLLLKHGTVNVEATTDKKDQETK